MRKIILGLIATVSISTLSFGQATLEHSYSSNWTNNQNNWGALEAAGGPLSAFNVESGICYYTLDIPWDNTAINIMRIYNEQHVLIKTVNFPTRPNRINFITDKLFNQDNLIEILYTDNYNLCLINENSVVVQIIQNKGFARVIKTPSDKYKLVVSTNGGDNKLLYDVYSLSGTLSVPQQDVYLKTSFVGYPNPTDSNINITNKLTDGEKGVLEIFDANGKKVIAKNITGGSKEISLDVSELSNGVYIYKLNGQTNRFIKK
ncbi:T9SS type A sorting domain-containing protein [Flavobacterium sp. HJSW_4]|uniref:T9SS type A sorting domain-containing protein n=1 Tax=Flavobacterium sp. HJSW_4 TaxID=3344660 RepID=UPI0035F41E92